MTMLSGVRIAVVVLGCLVGSTSVVSAQDTASVRAGDRGVAAPAAAPDSAARPDSLRQGHVAPLGALWRSFLLPGWGQAKLNRKLTGGIFVAWEGVTLGMALKTRQELGYLRRTNSGRGNSKRQEHEDWLVLMAFNHLFAGLEAYVSAHLSDFPDDLRFRAVPVPGGAAATLSLPFQLR
jgi:hypothetical protein